MVPPYVSFKLLGNVDGLKCENLEQSMFFFVLLLVNAVCVSVCVTFQKHNEVLKSPGDKMCLNIFSSLDIVLLRKVQFLLFRC